MTTETETKAPRVAAPYRMRYDLHEPVAVDRYIARQLERERWAALSQWRSTDEGQS